jgi:hypothetical protein
MPAVPDHSEAYEYLRNLYRYIRDDSDKYEGIIIQFYNYLSFVENPYLTEDTRKKWLQALAPSICYTDPEWALAEIGGTKRCDRCHLVFVESEWYCIKNRSGEGQENYISCESCADYIRSICASPVSSESENNSVESEDEEERSLDDNDDDSRN